MKRSLFFIAVACLAAGFSSVCFAQDPPADDSSNLTRDELQSGVDAKRERLEHQREELRLQHEKQIGPRREELQLEREKQFGPKQEELRVDRDERLGPKQEEIRVDREKRIEPKREGLRFERDEQRELKGIAAPPSTQAR
jgi:hypothetical protein